MAASPPPRGEPYWRKTAPHTPGQPHSAGIRGSNTAATWRALLASMAPRHILLLLWVAADAANNTTLAPSTFAPTTTPAPTSSRHHPEACQERCYPEEGQNYDEDCCALRDRMSCLGNYTLIQLGYVCASGDGWKAHAYECVPCEGPACDNGPGDDASECDDHGMWWLWVIFLPMFVSRCVEIKFRAPTPSTRCCP